MNGFYVGWPVKIHQDGVFNGRVGVIYDHAPHDCDQYWYVVRFDDGTHYSFLAEELGNECI
jgi:hypothetical protein